MYWATRPAESCGRFEWRVSGSSVSGVTLSISTSSLRSSVTVGRDEGDYELNYCLLSVLSPSALNLHIPYCSAVPEVCL